MKTEFRIYPSIGIARVGDSTNGFFIGPEAPGLAPEGPFRDNNGGLKPQASRFRIYEIEVDDSLNERVVREVVPDAQTFIEWNVTLANRKAAAREIFGHTGGTLSRSTDAPFRNGEYDRNGLVISGTGTTNSTVPPDKSVGITGSIRFAKEGIVEHEVSNLGLATLRTDSVGRLLVIGGTGAAGSIPNAGLPSFSDNHGWYDTVSDGPVTAALTLAGMRVPVVPSWVVVTVPRYAPGIYGIVTWYDQAVYVARSSLDGTMAPPQVTSFTKHIYSVLKRADAFSAVHFIPHRLASPSVIKGYRDDPSKRLAVVKHLTKPGTDAKGPQELSSSPPGMPYLYSGANPDPGGATWTFCSLTPYQMAHFHNWEIGNYVDDWVEEDTSPVSLESITLQEQPAAITRAALEACVGGSFFPGIEGTYDIARHGTYHPNGTLRHEFRVHPDLQPGFFTEKMALPWQADFADCEQYWWPSQRPVRVLNQNEQAVQWTRGIDSPNDETRHRNMVNFWTHLGFITMDPTTGRHKESERKTINGVP